MCGIIAVVRRPSERVPASGAELLALVEQASAASAGFADLAPGPALVDLLDAVAAPLVQADALLRGSPGVRTLLADPALTPTLDRLTAGIEARADAVEGALDHAESLGSTAELELVNAALVRLRDAAWAIRRDRLPTAARVAELAGSDPGLAAIEAYLSLQQVLSAIDRLEVRGRDSAGIHVLVHGHGLDLEAPSVRALLDGRDDDPRFVSGAVRVADGHLAFVYKAAAEIGELGDNTAALRAAIADDALLRLALSGPTAEALVLGHTRWASVGIISEPNAHPVCGEESDGVARPYVAAALNGDVDNHADLRAEEGLVVAAEITTDAKVIPALTARRLAEGDDLDEAFRRTVATLEGSVAIAATNGVAPERLHLALRGSGQALYVGLAEDAFIVASEPYGLVEETSTYVRMDGETPANPENPTASRGQVLVLDGARAGTVEGIGRVAYDGTELPVAPSRPGQGRDHDPGHRPGRLPALPAQGDDRGPGLVPQDPAGSVDRTGRPGRRGARAGDPARRAAGAAAGGPHPPGPRHRPGHRCRRRAEPGGHPRGAHPRQPGAGGGRRGHRTVRVRAGRGHVRHPGRGHLPVRDHHRHQPDGRPGPLPRGRRGGHRQPSGQRPDRQGRRCPLHLRRAGRGDERRVDQGLLRPGGRGGPPRRRPGRRARGAGHGRADGHAGRVAGPARRAHPGPRGPGAHRGDRPGAGPGAALLGRGRQRAQPHRRRRGPDQAVGALLQVDRL